MVELLNLLPINDDFLAQNYIHAKSWDHGGLDDVAQVAIQVFAQKT